MYTVSIGKDSVSVICIMSPSGGRRTAFVRKWRVWEHLRDFFPIKVSSTFSYLQCLDDVVFRSSSDLIKIRVELIDVSDSKWLDCNRTN